MRTRYRAPTHRRLRGTYAEQEQIGHLYNLIVFGIVIVMLLLMAGGIPPIL